MKKILFFASFFLLASCVNISTPNSSVSVGSDGISVNTTGSSVEVTASGVSVNTNNNALTLGQLASISAGNVEISDEEKTQFAHLSAETFEINNCDTQFNQLVKTFGNNYDACFAIRKEVNNCSSDKKVGKVNVVIILDASGSMGATIGGETMMDIAKSEVKNYISSLDGAVGGGLIVYGHKGSSRSSDSVVSCGGIENFGNFSDKNSLISRVDSLRATGWTPLSTSLEQAEKYLNSISSPDDQKVIVLISDGKETCGGNPVATAQLIASKDNFFIDVIGFNVAGATQKELQQIALAGGGKYSDVKSRLDFQNVFADMKAFSREISCGASQASLVLRDAAETLNTYHSCMYNLREEEVKIMTHITMSCENDVTKLMESRVQKISSELEKLEIDAKNRLNNFEKSIQDVIERF